MIWIGTSGYDYPEWKGSFYPTDISAAEMLPYYAARFSSVEINYTFYRMPTEKSVSAWAKQTPEGFSFTLKGPKRITHTAMLRDCQDDLSFFCARARNLGPKLGVLFFQLPPWSRKNLEVLGSFLQLVPPDLRVAFEFRHASWHAEDVYSLLRERKAALCIADSEKLRTPVVLTAGHAYFRLRDEGYTEADIAKWAGIVRESAKSVSDCYVYFKHEEEGKGTEFARLFKGYLEQG